MAAPKKFKKISNIVSFHPGAVFFRNRAIEYSANSHKKVTATSSTKIKIAESVKLDKNIATKKPPKKCSSSKNQ